MKRNLVVKASAGTGKTFAIATRFIRLLVFGGEKVRPETILGLTFSRAAAQEIYEKILNRLRAAAESDEGAAAERDLLVGDLDPGTDAAEIGRAPRIDWSPAMFAGVLRRVIDAQGHDTIATIDSFIQRIVRSFPVEMGFQRSLSLLDDYGAALATADAVAGLVGSTADDERLRRDFAASQDGRAVRSGIPKFKKIAEDWRGFFADHPEAKGWTFESMCRSLGIDDETERPDLSAVHVEERSMRFVEDIRKHVEAFDGTQDVFPKNKTGEILRYFHDHPSATAMEPFKHGNAKEPYAFDCGPDGAAALRAAVRRMVARAMRRRLGIVAAKLSLFRSIDDRYDALARGSGRLSFSDFTESLAGGKSGMWESPDRKSVLRNLQFRLDSEFGHWSLDEFQDTSMVQWDCLRPLVEAAVEDAASGGERSVLAVGDLKQSIYTWRGGNDRPFRELESLVAANGGASRSLVRSYRYGRNTADFVNAVFGPENVRATADGACPDAVAKWIGQCWPANGHEAPETGDHVEIVGVERTAESGAQGAADPDEDDGDFNPSAAMRVLVSDIGECVRGLWERHEADKAAAARLGRPFRSDGIAILVRRNADGLYLSERLRTVEFARPDGGRDRLPVVWEGESGILDSPVVRAVLELLALAEHPEDRFSWAVVNGLFPLRETVFAGEEACETPADVSARVAESLSRLGLSRTLQRIASRLKAGRFPVDERTAMRLDQLVREAVKFEGRPDTDAGISSFRDYLSSVSDREIASSPDVIRILTIHRSKGLTIDHVVVPVTECGSKAGLLAPKDETRLVGDGWVLESLPADLARTNERTAKALDDAANGHFLDELRTWYVALTRAVKSTYVFVVQEGDRRTTQFRDLLLKPFDPTRTTECGYGTILHSVGDPPSFTTERKEGERERTPPAAWVPRDGRDFVGHATPSAGTASGGTFFRQSVSSLFAGQTPGNAAARHGTEEHAALAAIGWIDPAAPKDERERAIVGSAWREAFVETPGAVLWRERSYELLVGNDWETGQFDRVVFRGEGDARTATVYDFKTNRRRDGETDEAFAERMKREYALQMAAYRRALSLLCGIPADRIGTVLLLSATMGAVPVPPLPA